MAATSYETEQEAIMTRLEDKWLNETPIKWPNRHYEPDGSAYIEPVVNRQTAFNADIATNRRIRHPGLLTVNVRAPLNEGDKAALGLADDIVDIYRNVTFDGITFRAPTVRDFGRQGKWYWVQVDCPYQRDSTH